MQPSLVPVIAFLNQVETTVALSILEQEGIPATVEGYYQATMWRNGLAIQAYTVYVNSDHFGLAAAALEHYAHAPRQRTAGWWRAYRRLLLAVGLWCGVSMTPFYSAGLSNLAMGTLAAFLSVLQHPPEPIGTPTIYWRKRREDEEG